MTPNTNAIFASDKATAEHCFRWIPESQALAQAARLRAARQRLIDSNTHLTATGSAFKYDRGPCVLARAS